jgi:hypothetical protein
MNIINPRDTREPFLNENHNAVACAKSVEVNLIHRHALPHPPFSPRCDDQPVTSRQARHAERADDVAGVNFGLAGIKSSVGVKQRGQNPQHRNQPIIDALQNFNIAMTPRATVQPKRDCERREKNAAGKNPNSIEFKRRINLAGGNEYDRTGKKPRCASHQTPAKNDLRRGDGQSTRYTLSRGTLRAAFDAVKRVRGHGRIRDATSASNRSNPFGSATSKLTPIPCPGATRRTVHCSSSGGCTPSRASNRAPTHSG